MEGRLYGQDYGGRLRNTDSQGNQYYTPIRTKRITGQGYIWSPSVVGYRNIDPMPINRTGGRELTPWQSDHRQQGPVWVGPYPCFVCENLYPTHRSLYNHMAHGHKKSELDR